MPNDTVRIVFVGDIIGRYGRRMVRRAMPLLKAQFQPDVIIANGENSAGGIGIIKKTADELFDTGIDIITTGNHVWDKREAQSLLKENSRIIRPINFPPGTPGAGKRSFRTTGGTTGIVINVQGRVFMEPVVDNPFLAVKEAMKSIEEKIIIVDFHAEASAESQAMGFYLDGRVSAVLGTHTHVQTSDIRILKKGTAYQTDVGMTGALDSVIGMKKEPIIKKFLTGINQRFEVSRETMVMEFSVIDVNVMDGRAVRANTLRWFESELEE